jgi:hypothetical protein
MLEQLRQVNVDRLELDGLVSLSAFAKSLTDEYKRLKIDPPEWVGHSVETLNVEIKSRIRADLIRHQRQARQQLELLKTPTEKKTALRKEIEAIEAQLAS